jgi:hypothetical protein
MAAYRIYRMKEQASQQFRWAPHVSGATQVKRKDYDEGSTAEAPNEYAAWIELREAGTPLRVGDLLEAEGGDLRICKYVGFDAAQWIVPEVKTGLESAPVAAGPVQDTGEACH